MSVRSALSLGINAERKLHGLWEVVCLLGLIWT